VLAALGAVAETTGSPVIDLVLPFLNLGVIVVIVLMVVTKTGLVPKWVLDDAVKAHDREVADLKEVHERELAGKNAQIGQLLSDRMDLKEDNDKLADTMLNRAIPALTEANRLSAQWIDAQNRRAFGGPQ
jgi:hypothetical protein